MAWLDPAVGNFNHVDSVDFGRDIPAATTVTADQDTGTADNTAGGQESQVAAAPSVRDEADEGGRVRNRQNAKPSGLEKFFNFFRGGDKKKKDSTPSPNRSR